MATAGGGNSAVEKFFSVLLKGESKTYSCHNYYTSKLNSCVVGGYGKRFSLLNKDLEEYTIGEIQGFMQQSRSSSSGQLYACGLYQMIPGTFNEQVKSLGLASNVKFNKKTQDAMALQILKAKPAIKKFLEGKSSDLAAAQLGLAQIWSSVGVPYTTTYNGKTAQRNQSFYSYMDTIWMWDAFSCGLQPQP
jgi:hypothetical protein